MAFQSRQEYLEQHPGEKFNRYIERGEVVKGMNLVQVCASWGLPETRRLSKDKKQEHWTFLEKDELSGDWKRYTLSFESGVLIDWQLDLHFVKNGSLTDYVAGDRDPSPNAGGPPSTSSPGADRQ